MGRYLNPGNEGFRVILRDRYVDKTGLIARMNEVLEGPNKLVCVSRPRRFGKSFAAQSLVAYYSYGCDSRALFVGRDVSRDTSFEECLNAYDVVSLDITDIIHRLGTGSHVAPVIQEEVISELREAYPGVCVDDDLGGALLSAVEHTGRKFVFVIDEWDAVFREAKDDEAAQREYVGLLRSIFKSNTVTARAIAGAYLTGILPIKKYGTQSAMNDFREYTMVLPARFAPYVGFSEDEVRVLCAEYEMDFELLRRWYDGYDLPGVGAVYAPNSVMQACQNHAVGSYWTSSETYESLRSFIDMDFDGLQACVARLVAGDDEPVNTLGFQNDMVSIANSDDVLTLLVHLGYLAYDEESGTVRVPNEEVRLEFALAVREGGHPELARMVREADALLSATIMGDEDAVAAGVARAHDSAIGPDWYNDEQALRLAVKLAYLTSVDKFARIEEMPSGHGRADVVFLPKRRTRVPAIVVELKWNKDAQTALDQIRDRNYPAVLRDYGGPVLLVGITYDAKNKGHACHIERLAPGHRE